MTKGLPEFVRCGRLKRSTDHGAALIIVLLLMATLSTIAVGMSRTMQKATARAYASEAVSQARWYVQGAEIFSILLMEEQWKREPARDTLKDIWVSETATFPIEAGLMIAELKDATVCFNINSLVAGTPQERRANDKAVTEYGLLLSALGFNSSARAALTDSLIDWLDTDGIARPDGAEDIDYGSLDVPYRAANTLIGDLSELRAVYYYSAPVYERLKPFICAHPSMQSSALNLNMVTENTAPVLFAMLGGVLSLTEVQNLIDARPENGFTTVEEFWLANPVLQAQPPGDDLMQRPNLWSRYVRLEAQVSYDQVSMAMTSLLEVSRDGTAGVKSRKFGLIE